MDRKLRLEKVVTSKQLRLAVETEEERRVRLENDATTKQLRLAMEMDEERKALLEKMVATTQLRFTWRQKKKEDQKRNGFDLYLIWIEIGVSKNKHFQGMSSLDL